MKTLLVSAAAVLLAACGQTGPLRLPEPPPATTEAPPSAAADDATEPPKTTPSP